MPKKGHFGMKNVAVALSVSSLASQPQNCRSKIENDGNAESLLQPPLPFP